MRGVTCHGYEPFKCFQGLGNVIVIHVVSPTPRRKEEDVHPNTTSMSLQSNKNADLWWFVDSHQKFNIRTYKRVISSGNLFVFQWGPPFFQAVNFREGTFCLWLGGMGDLWSKVYQPGNPASKAKRRNTQKPRGFCQFWYTAEVYQPVCPWKDTESQ